MFYVLSFSFFLIFFFIKCKFEQSGSRSFIVPTTMVSYLRLISLIYLADKISAILFQFGKRLCELADSEIQPSMQTNATFMIVIDDGGTRLDERERNRMKVALTVSLDSPVLGSMMKL